MGPAEIPRCVARRRYQRPDIIEMLNSSGESDNDDSDVSDISIPDMVIPPTVSMLLQDTPESDSDSSWFWSGGETGDDATDETDETDEDMDEDIDEEFSFDTRRFINFAGDLDTSADTSSSNSSSDDIVNNNIDLNDPLFNVEQLFNDDELEVLQEARRNTVGGVIEADGQVDTSQGDSGQGASEDSVQQIYIFEQQAMSHSQEMNFRMERDWMTQETGFSHDLHTMG